MKIILFSDSHGGTDYMCDVILEQEPNAVIHCGDHIRDARRISENFPRVKFYMVAGNCDYVSSHEEEEQVFELCGRRFFITHGNLYGVKMGYTKLMYAAAEKGADFVICGHTHIPKYDSFGDIVLINPGSVSYGRRSYGILNLTEDSFDYKLEELR